MPTPRRSISGSSKIRFAAASVAALVALAATLALGLAGCSSTPRQAAPGRANAVSGRPGSTMPPATAVPASAGVSQAAGAAASVDTSAQIEATISHLNSLDISAFRGKKVKHGDPATKMVALTFDDGPSKNTLALVAVLKRYHVKATFFFVGGRAQDNPTLPPAVLAEGSEIGNHTYNHVRLVKLDPAQFEAQIGRTQRVIEALTGYTPKVVRPQGGRQDAAGIADAAKDGLVLVDWNVHSQDTDKKLTVAGITRNALGARAGSIILMHETRKESIEAVPGIIKGLEVRGLKLVTISELLAASK